MIGDSVTESFDYVPAAKRYLGRGLDLRADAVVCRRLVAASCAFQGAAPATALEVVDAEGRALGPVVVINVGYNDWAAVYDVDRVVRALGGAGVRHVIWVTLREAGANASIYAQSNARIRGAGKRWGTSLSVADWNAFSRGKPWFRQDGLHLSRPGRSASHAAPAPARGRRRRVELASPRLLHSRVENPWKFALGARVSGWTIRGSPVDSPSEGGDNLGTYVPFSLRREPCFALHWTWPVRTLTPAREDAA